MADGSQRGFGFPAPLNDTEDDNLEPACAPERIAA